ncbi:MAG: serine-type D-Ala-D-Ala carboxypeptidase, partial [Pseudomonadales bacterium]|nr:serine-type D-Ala-D-Ala carboxypeptidase [Pseudomonadales bacterium]
MSRVLARLVVVVLALGASLASAQAPAEPQAGQPTLNAPAPTAGQPGVPIIPAPPGIAARAWLLMDARSGRV